jgi:hypothetical protein
MNQARLGGTNNEWFIVSIRKCSAVKRHRPDEPQIMQMLEYGGDIPAISRLTDHGMIGAEHQSES